MNLPLLNAHTLRILFNAKLRTCSFTLTDHSLALCVSKEVEPIRDLVNVVGVDRNLNNLTIGNDREVTCYDMSKATEIAGTTRSIIRSFKRNNDRIRGRVAGKYGERRKRRVHQLLNKVSKQIVESALKSKQEIVFEDIRDIRRLYRKGNWQGKRYRGEMNSWSFQEIKRQIEYKAAWLGVPVVTLTKSETRGTSVTCPRCGERLQGSRELKRKLWCQKCREIFDRDVVAVINISRWGRLRLRTGPKALDVKQWYRNPARSHQVILKVDPTKLTRRLNQE